MNIIEFITHFPEESCEIYLKAYRENTGIYCKTCTGCQNITGLVRASFLNAVNAGEGLLSKLGW